jgi:hypothetical protein
LTDLQFVDDLLEADHLLLHDLTSWVDRGEVNSWVFYDAIRLIEKLLRQESTL